MPERNEKLVRVRKYMLGMTQRELAAELGVIRETVARWETGSQPIPARQETRVYKLVSRMIREEGGVPITRPTPDWRQVSLFNDDPNGSDLC